MREDKSAGHGGIFVASLRGLSMRAKGLAFVIGSHMPICIASLKTMAAEGSMSVSSARRSLRELEDAGVVKTIVNGGKNGTYRIILCWDAGTKEGDTVTVVPRKARKSPMGESENSHGNIEELPRETDPVTVTAPPGQPDTEGGQPDAPPGQPDRQTFINVQERSENIHIGDFSEIAEDEVLESPNEAVKETEPYDVNRDPTYLALLENPYSTPSITANKNTDSSSASEVA